MAILPRDTLGRGVRDRGQMARLRERVAVQPGFSPRGIAGLAAWYQADAGTSTTTDGSAISQWDDQSGNARHLTQATGSKRPLYKTAILAGKPTVRFDGVDDFLQTGAFTLNAPDTWFVVCQWRGAYSANNLALDGKASQFVHDFGRTASTAITIFITGAVSATTTPQSFHYYTLFWDSGTNGGVIRIDGAAATSGNVGTANPGGLTVGADQTGANAADVDVCEVIAYSGTLNAGDYGAVEAYLAAKWFSAAGPVNNTSSLTAVLSFTGSQAKQTSRALAAVLSFTGAVTKRTTRALAATLSFTGSATKSTAHKMTAVLSFTGAQGRAVAKGLTATLSFTGATSRAVARALTAMLTFIGATVKRSSRALTGILSFTGALASGKQFARALVGVLSFTGSQARLTGKALTAGLTFTGSASRAITRALVGTLSFAGTTAKSTRRALAAILSFTGSLASGKQFARALAATLSFTGASSRTTGKALVAVVSFTGAVAKRTGRVFPATLTFAGNAANRTARALTATLSFTGATATSRLFVRALTASLGFTGSTAKRTAKAFTGALAATAGFATNFIAGPGAAAKTLLLRVTDLARITVNAMSIGRTTAMSSTEALVGAASTNHGLSVHVSDASRISATATDGPAQ